MNARRNIPAALAGLAIYLLLVVAFPSTAIAQEVNPDTVCGRCAWSDDAEWPSTECRAGLPAVPNFPDRFCVTRTTGSTTEVCRYERERECDRQFALADDLEAIGRVMGGDVLPPSGSHFFLVDAAGTATVMRKCDRAVIARIPAETLAIAVRRRSALRVG